MTEFSNFFIMILIALSLGIRHGLDIDHIIAIDNVVRNLAIKHKKTFTVGMFFALGHSTIVFIMTLFLVLGIAVLKEHSNLLTIGKCIGNSISVGFLWITGLLNMYTLAKTTRDSSHHQLHSQSLLGKITRPLFKMINHPFKMYYVGMLFGLGFDTSTEIMLLGLAASAAIKTPLSFYILFLPIAFAIGMIITDSIDSLIMTKIFYWTSKKKQHYKMYNIIITVVITMLSLVVGLSEFIYLITNRFHHNKQNFLQFIDRHTSEFGLVIVIMFTFIFLCMFFVNKISSTKFCRLKR